MPRAAMSIATIILAMSALATPAAIAQISPEKAAYGQRKATLDALTAEYEAAATRFEANETALDREHGAIKQRQALIDLRKREYREALARCQEVTCIDRLNPQRDALNADQMLMNREIDAYNARMDQRESEAAKLDLMEAHLAELREQLRRQEQEQTPR